MKIDKNLKNEILIGVCLSASIYYVIKKMQGSVTQTVVTEPSNTGSENTNPSTGNGSTVTPVVTSYQAKYFKDSEYFGKNKAPEKYYNSWKALSMILDKIRIAFGSAVIITKGYEPVYNGVILNSFNMCSAVQIYPQNNDYDHLFSVCKSLLNLGNISVKKLYQMDSKQIFIEM
ncbi:hypothetical protein [Chryseobacterium defluvii]|uniref:Uncharacterized protein n=1 Tax=Chryseobacterium defluvii TaxID=160396 RepID=A0A495SEA2_9FLAO|nr:hypothetical protein [Chryseobacterium defluvii]RKS98234.1 hypothetical protein BCF58_2375 [Chryseobacterium defluvii]